MKFVSSEGTVTSSPTVADAETWHDPGPAPRKPSLSFVPASAMQRGLAFLIDAMVLFVLYVLSEFLFAFIGVSTLLAALPQDGMALFGGLALAVIALGYFTGFHAAAAATPGMRWMRIGLMMRSGRAPGIGVALVRNAIFLFLATAIGFVASAFRGGEMMVVALEGAALLLLVLPIFFTAERVTLHDWLTQTRVKDIPASSDQARSRGGNSV